MKTIYLIILLGLFQTNPLTAQHAKNHDAAAKQILAQLNLNDAQKQQIKALRQEAKNARIKNQQTFGSDKKALHEANQKLKVATEGKMQNILTPEQWKQFVALKDKMRQDKMNTRIDSLAAYLQLNDEQKKSFASLTLAKNNKLKENKDLYHSQPETLHKANKETNQAYRDQISKILTPAQLAKLKSWKKDHKKQ